jgi:hypothetical protein
MEWVASMGFCHSPFPIPYSRPEGGSRFEGLEQNPRLRATWGRVDDS